MKSKLLQILLITLFLACVSKSSNIKGERYTSHFVLLECNDTLNFITDSKLYLYACDINFKYDCFYRIKGDTIIVESNLSQDEDISYDKYDINFRMKLFKDNDKLIHIITENKRSSGWERNIIKDLDHFTDFVRIN